MTTACSASSSVMVATASRRHPVWRQKDSYGIKMPRSASISLKLSSVVSKASRSRVAVVHTMAATKVRVRRAFVLSPEHDALWPSSAHDVGYFRNAELTLPQLRYPSTPIPQETFASFDDLITNSSVPVLVDFYATWCGPCQLLSTQVSSIAPPGVYFCIYMFARGDTRGV